MPSVKTGAPKYQPGSMKMWSCQNLPFTLCIALSCVRSVAGLIHVSGYEGGKVNISCTYGEGYESYEKYLCKNDCNYEDVLITTTEANKNKYSTHDDKQRKVFVATISDLSQTDAGKYWCGVTRNGKDIYTEVELDVGPESCCDHSTKVQSYEESSVSIICQYEQKDDSSLKYICRGNQASTCLEKAVVTSDNKQNGQFRLTDDKLLRKFTVTITSLTQDNSGSYLCGIRGNSGLDVFSAFELEVKEWCCVKLNKVSGIVGDPATMQCPYPSQYRGNRKFLCKGDHRNNCTDMVTSQSRFTLQDDVSTSSFLVMITELKAGDAGTYWCGSHPQWSVGNYTKIQLSVVSSQQTSTVTSTTKSTQIPGKEDAAPSHFVVYIVPVVLLILTFVLIMVYRYKCYKVQGAGSNTNRNRTKAEEAKGRVELYSKQQRARRHCEDPGEAQQECVYQNVTTDDIYCNQIIINANR